MKHFAALFLQLDPSTKATDKAKHLADYFRVAEEKDKLWAIALLSQQRPKRIVPTTVLQTWAATWSTIPLWLFEASYKVTKDWAETIALIVPVATQSSTYSLSYWIEYIQALDSKTEGEQQAAIQAAYVQLEHTERLVFTKLLTGSFRAEVSQKLLSSVLSTVLEIPENQIAHRLTGDWSPDTIRFDELMLRAHPSDDISMLYPFCLAHELEGEAKDLGEVGEWQAERKWDGIRGQLIVRKGELFVWTRAEELISDRLPEYQPLSSLLPDGTVLDGEILACKKGEILTFNILQTRLGRKKLAKKVLLQAPLIFMAYELLEYQGEDIRTRPMSERRTLLEELLQQYDTQGIIQVSEVLKADSWSALAAIRATARQQKCEGLMLKRKSSPYQSGRKRGDWWKWKIDPLTIDAVLIYAQGNSGQGTKRFADYTFAVRDGDRLVPFTKASSGLTDKEIREITAWVRQNTVEKFGPVRSVRPQHVFEIAFDDIRPSTRHKSGIVLRNPRILRWRKDKTVQMANSLEDLKGMLD